MEIWRDPAALRAWRRSQGGSVGCVPTMGALHLGHRSLLERAGRECDATVATIFVNPTQFNDPKDCATYPQPLETDVALCRACGVSGVFLPTRDQLYPDDYSFKVVESRDSLRWEGEFRPGHFDGVLTVVLKLLQLVTPTRAYFGEKDWQQLSLVRRMVEAFFLPVDIVPCETVREDDGLALSSRNVRLSAAARARAAAFPQALVKAPSAEAAAERLRAAGFEVEYVTDADGRRLGAVVLDGVRLIDNWPLSHLSHSTAS